MITTTPGIEDAIGMTETDIGIGRGIETGTVRGIGDAPDPEMRQEGEIRIGIGREIGIGIEIEIGIGTEIGTEIGIEIVTAGETGTMIGDGPKR